MKDDISWKQPFREIQPLLFFFYCMEVFLLSGCQENLRRVERHLADSWTVFHRWVFLISRNHSRSNILHKNFHASIVRAFFTNEEAKDDVKENDEWKV